MKLLVLAQTPPPLHGQSLMVRTLVTGLPSDRIGVVHVNLPLSRDGADVGRVRPGKIFTACAAAFRAVVEGRRHRCDALYYVPAPAKRGALYRDWLILLLCRPWFRHTVLHWHAAGLGAWLATHATGVERALSQLALGRADLALVLGDALASDAAVLRPRRTVVVRNGIADPCPGFARPPRRDGSALTALFIGLCSREKGVLASAAAIVAANSRAADAGGAPRFRLVAAGDFADAATRREFDRLADASGGAVRHVGFAAGEAKHRLFADADVLVFPTRYPHETQGLVVAEALAYDLPVITTRWRAVHENLPGSHVHFVPPDDPAAIAAALEEVRTAPPPHGSQRAHFLAHYTVAPHLRALEHALRALGGPAGGS